MKTVIIYNNMLSITEPKFLVLEGDYRRFDGLYINQYGQDTSELCNLIYNETTGQINQGINFLDKFPTQEVLNGAFVIVAGFLA